MSQNNIFEQALRKKVRFDSVKGELTTEQLLGMKLESRDGFSLEAVAQTVNRALKEVAEESFVKTSTNPLKAQLELKLEIVKFIIAEKIAEEDKKKLQANKADERKILLEALANQKTLALKALTPEEIEARLKALDAE